MNLRHLVRDRFDAALAQRAAPFDEAQLTRSLLIVAPHPDDETLASGGLVARACDAGAEVRIVFVSDGASSHGDAADLAAQRRREGAAAAAVLGVDASRLDFLDLPDAGVASRIGDGIDRLASILEVMRPERLVAPHPDEPHPDHRATYHIVRGALDRVGLTVDALLAPVWLWDQFPWTSPFSPPTHRRSARHTAALSARQALGFRLTRQLDTHVDVEAVVDRKRRALDEHRSQMERRDGDPTWLTLGDIADGEWLAQLMRPVEYYTAQRLGAGGARR